VFLGDYNLPDINWDTLCSNSVVAEKFCDMCFEQNLTQLMSCSTHIHGNTLDLVLINNDDLIESISVSFTNNLPIESDHYAITFELSLNQQNKSHSMCTISQKQIFLE